MSIGKLGVVLLIAVLLLELLLPDAGAAPRRSVSESGVLLVSGSMQLGPVYYARGSDDHVRGAAEDMAAVLGRISGREWPVMEEPPEVVAAGVFVGATTASRVNGISVGDPDDLPLDAGKARLAQSQRFRVAVSGRRVIIAGATPEATVTGVYYFLQRYAGVRWYSPGEIGEELPAGARVRLPRINEEVTPSFYSRTLMSSGRGAAERQWMQRNLLTARWRFNHNLHRLVTPDLLDHNPDWFSVIGGRLTPTSGGKGPNPNLINPELAVFVAEKADAFFEENPAEKTFSISVTDNVNFDESPATLEVVTPFRFFRGRPDYSDLVFGFSNRVAEQLWPLSDDGEIRFEEVPTYLQDKYLGALAYYWAEQVPSFPVHPRIIPYLTSDRAQWFSQDYREEDKALIKAWCQAGPEIIGTWDYYEGGPYYIPRVFTGNVAESIPFLNRAGVRAFYAEGRARWGFDAPRIWLASQLLFNSGQSSKRLLKDFYEGYFRESALPMRRFFEECERVWMNQPEPAVWLKFWLMPGQAEIFPPEVWEKLESYLQQAERQAKSQRVKERLALVRADFDYAKAAVALYWAWKNVFQQPGDARALASLAEARHDFEPMQEPAALDRFRIHTGLLEITQVPVVETPPTPAALVLQERFEIPLVGGDEQPVGPLPLRAARLRDGWRSSSFHNDTFVMQRTPLAAAIDNYGLRVEGATYFSLFQWLPGEPGDRVDFRLRFRGKVSVGSRFVITIQGMDRQGKLWASAREAEVPPGEYPEWRVLARQVELPEDTAWYSIGFRFNQQMPGDYMELDDLQVSTWRDDA